MKNLALERPLAFFDLETTGVNPAKDRIVEIAVIKINPDRSRAQFVRRLNPEMPIPPESSLIHGIYDADVADAPVFRQIAHDLKQFLHLADIGGFNSNRFDIPVLMEEFLRAGVSIDLKKKKFIDVQQIFFKMEERTLKAAYQFYCNKELENAHSAEADVLATIEVLDAQLERYAQLQKHVDALHDFCGGDEYMDYGRRIILKDGEPFFHFGKYKGQRVEDVFAKEPQYYDWMMKSDFSLHTKHCISEILNGMLLKKNAR